MLEVDVYIYIYSFVAVINRKCRRGICSRACALAPFFKIADGDRRFIPERLRRYTRLTASGLSLILRESSFTWFSLRGSRKLAAAGIAESWDSHIFFFLPSLTREVSCESFPILVSTNSGYVHRPSTISNMNSVSQWEPPKANLLRYSTLPVNRKGYQLFPLRRFSRSQTGGANGVLQQEKTKEPRRPWHLSFNGEPTSQRLIDYAEGWGWLWRLNSTTLACSLVQLKKSQCQQSSEPTTRERDGETAASQSFNRLPIYLCILPTVHSLTLNKEI